jgi:hypothetical protein
MPKLSQAASHTLPMPAARVPNKIANKVIQVSTDAQQIERTWSKSNYACALRGHR